MSVEQKQRHWQPYPSYKSSGIEWLEDVPEHWEVRRLKYSADLVNQKIDGNESDLPYAGLEHIESWTGKLLSSNGSSSSDGQANLFRQGDVLFGKLRPYLAKAHAAEFDGISTTELLVLRPKALQQKFLLDYFLNPQFISIVDSSTYGAKMPRANWDFIGNLPILIPPLQEQHTIAAFLDHETARIDTLIEKKQRQIELLREKRSALISHAVTKGLDPNVRMKDSGIEWLGEIPEHWEVKSVRRIASSVKTGSTPSGAEEIYFDENGFNWYTPSDFNDKITLEESHRKLSELGKKEVRIFPAMTVMMIGIGATIGKVALSREPASCNQQINAIICNSTISPKFLTYFLKILRDYVIRCGKFTTLPIINQEDTKNLIITCPLIPEQDEIVSFLDKESEKTDTLIQKICLTIGKLREYRTALISAAVTGKIDVRREVA